MSNIIKKIVTSAALQMKDLALRNERETFAKQKAALLARETELQAIEEERNKLQVRRDTILAKQANLDRIKQRQIFKLEKSANKTDEYSYWGIPHIEDKDTPSSYDRRIITARTYEFHLRNFLENDIPKMEQRLSKELAEVDAEVDAFEKREL